MTGRSGGDRWAVVELLPPETGRAFAVMRELRTRLARLDDFVRQVDDVQRPEGYRLVAAVASDGGDAVSVAGFRLRTSLSWGRHVYVDDLSTLPAFRGLGLAGRLLAWVHGEARRLGCAEVHLDSGVGPTRSAAHRLYLNCGYVISAHHFVRHEPVADGTPERPSLVRQRARTGDDGTSCAL